MVQEQLRAGGIRDEKVLAVMTRVPRHEFVEGDQPYGDHAMPVGRPLPFTLPDDARRAP